MGATTVQSRFMIRLLAAQRARAAALIAAVARDHARRQRTHPAPAEEADAEAPPLPRETGLLVDGEVPLDQAASGRTPQPGPPRPQDSGKPLAQPGETRAEARLTGNVIATPEQSRVQVPQVRYIYPYHGQWYDLQDSKWEKYSPTWNPSIVIPTPTPTVPFIYHPTPPPSTPLITSTSTPSPNVGRDAPNGEALTPPVCPAPMPGESCVSYPTRFFPISSSSLILPGILPDAVGVRLEGSLWALSGLDLNLDVVYFFKSHQLHLFVTPGGQGGSGGGLDFSGGILVGWNLPDALAYSGPSLSGGGDIVLGGGFEGEISMGLTPSSVEPPVILYGGIAGAGSVGGYITMGETWDLDLVEAAKGFLQNLKGK